MSWAGEVWALPGVMDTLALVYLGCVLRQEPVRIGDVFRWARNGQMPFLAAVGARSWVGCAVLLLTVVADRLCAQGVEGQVARLGSPFSADEICPFSRRRAAQGCHGLDAGVQGEPRAGISRDTGTAVAVPLRQGYGSSSYAQSVPK